MSFPVNKITQINQHVGKNPRFEITAIQQKEVNSDCAKAIALLILLERKTQWHDLDLSAQDYVGI